MRLERSCFVAEACVFATFTTTHRATSHEPGPRATPAAGRPIYSAPEYILDGGGVAFSSTFHGNVSDVIIIHDDSLMSSS